MIARNANLTPGRILDILTGAARSFAAGNSCGILGLLCGSGMLDIAAALQDTLPGTVAPPGTVAVIEYYRADLDHYFYTADPAEAAFVDAVLGAIFQRTGEIFYAWANPALAPPGAKPVCRFYAGGPGFNSHYFTADAFECQFIIANWVGVWTLESFAAFYTVLLDANGQCLAGMAPVYKFFDGRQDATSASPSTFRAAVDDQPGLGSTGLRPEPRGVLLADLSVRRRLRHTRSTQPLTVKRASRNCLEGMLTASPRASPGTEEYDAAVPRSMT